MSDQTTLKNIPNATSSQELEVGRLPCSLQGGQQPDLFGQDLAPASRSAPQEKEKANTTNGTCGQSGLILSASANLQQSLENKLKARLPMGGLTMFIKGWKQKVTPSGRQYCQLAVLVRPISAVDYSLWATPNTMDHMAERSYEAMKRQAKNGGRKGRTFPGNLREQVSPLMCQAYREAMVENGKTPHGVNVNGLFAQTENKGLLNPPFPCWIMGYPQEWLNCAD